MFRKLVSRISGLSSRTPAQKSICFVSATRKSESKFWRESALGISLAPVLKSPGVSVQIFFENRRGLSIIYNECIRRKNSSDILIFLHDDVWFYDDELIEKIRSAHEIYDVVGLVGNIRRLPNQPAWAFRPVGDGSYEKDIGSFSGAIGTGDPEKFTVANFGPTPADCEMLDGVFISTNTKKLLSKKVLFDETFDFHFYDIDFCRTARQQKLNVGTWPIQLIHESPGAFGNEEWQKNMARYFRKWHD